MSGVQIYKTVAEIRDALSEKQVAFVPTMGSLHAGHQHLIEAAASLDMITVVSIFVNPTQFNDPDDFENYPRNLGDDVARAECAGCDVIFAPEPKEIYPPGDSTKVVVSGVTEGFEGTHRPGHFDGVATVVTKLFLVVQPNVAVFGEKDWQQCLVVRRLIDDLHLPIELQICKTLREPDGLAMSSRNARLTSEQRKVAPLLYERLCKAAEAARNGSPEVESENISALAESGFTVDYFEIVDPMTMTPSAGPGSHIVAAASLGDVRLIDNLLV